jgi:CSLREA domain-containing protein
VSFVGAGTCTINANQAGNANYNAAPQAQQSFGVGLMNVTTTADELNANGNCSLREAIRAANTDTAVDACPAGKGADVIFLPAGTYSLTIAGAGGSFYVSNTELSKIGGIVDYATIMTYDIHGTWDSYTDLNAPLYAPSETSPQYKWSVDQSVKAWESAGFPANKIVAGVPFYGYVYNNVSGGGTGLYKTFSGGGSVSYDKILSTYLTDSTYIKYLHSDALVPWLFNGSTFVSYDDETSVANKGKYIVQNNLAGAGIWELSQNKGGQLLTALTTNLK